MDNRPAIQRPAPPQRAVSGSIALQQGLKRHPVPSRLNNVRSFSQPVNIVDLTTEAPRSADVRNSAAFLSNQDAITTSPDVIDLSEDDNDRPAKRAKTNGHTFRAQTGTIDENDAAHRTIPGSPLPQLRTQIASSAKSTSSHKTETMVERTARRANGLEAPSMATRLPAPKIVADFTPWNGNHPEDIMSETVVKTGYYDKAPGPNSTESNSAKPTIWPNLSQKNNMGLQTLSYLFSQVMEKRQQLGKCTAPSTFKPPPRVTVTDTKREAWLRDLANPDVPLRKQSRTIPHGIRGKPLMEHCLVKEIPLPRAVWLAKCVGANELRAFRRKGVSGPTAASGELKWIRDWTVQVELFLEGVIADCGKPEWQAKMDYAVKLATSFYSERLLEREHYLDWIVSSFSQAVTNKLPIWIILAQLYWKDITAFERRGRKLAIAILDILSHISASTLFINNTLRDRLKKLIVVLAVTNRGCLILPKTWEKYHHLLAPETLTAESARLETPAQNILKRNSRLVRPLSKTPQNMRCPLLDLYSLLDAAGVVVDSRALTASCLTKGFEIQRLIPAVLDWCASIYRVGESRIYLGAKILTCLYGMGFDTNATILDYLRTADCTALTVKNVHRVIAELSRAGTFFPGRYLQWLMTSGILYSDHSSALIADLLVALPLDTLPLHLLSTRKTLMRRLSLQQDQDELLNRLAVDLDIANGLGERPGSHILSTIDGFSGSDKLELSRRLTLQATTWIKQEGITVDSYCDLRCILTRCDDHLSLSKVTQAALYTNDALLLAAVSDTVSFYAESFAAIGCLPVMLEQVLERYKFLRAHQPLERQLILSLVTLVRHCQDKTGVIRILENDLAICEQQNLMTVYSPASDNLIGMQADHLDSDNDIDAVFRSGNTMDEQLMQRVFNRIAQRAGKPGHSDLQAPGKICGWLNQLRTLDTSCFDVLAANFARGCLNAAGDNVASIKVICALVASGSLTFESLVALAVEVNTPLSAAILLELLTSSKSVVDGLHPAEAFRFHVQQMCCRDESAPRILPLLAVALEYSASATNRSLASLVLQYNQRGVDLSALTHQQSASYLTNSGRIALNVLQGYNSKGDSVDQTTAKAIVAMANPLSVVHCAAALRYYKQSELSKCSKDADASQSAILEAISNGCEVWPQLLECSGQDTIRTIYQWARDQILDKTLQGDGPLGTSAEVKRYLDILDVAHHSVADDDTGLVIGALSDKLKVIETRLTGLESIESNEREFRLTMASLQIVLHLCILFSVKGNRGEGEVLEQDCANLLTALCALLTHPGLQSHQAILEYIHDVASAAADNLSVNALQNIAKCASVGVFRDARLASILGAAPPPDSWLALVTHVQSQGTQQQRALMKQQMSARQVPQSPISQQKAPIRADGRGAADSKTVPFPLRRWEIMSDATPMVGENDTSLSLSLFGARKV